MQWHGFRVSIVLVSLVLGLGAFMGAQWLFNKYNYEQPLDGVLRKNPAISSYEIDDSKSVVLVRLELKEVENLGQTYRDIEASLKQILGSKQFEIELRDNRDQELEAVYYYGRFAVYEAIARGNYREMEKYISDRAASAGARARVYMDSGAIFVQISNNGHYLYEVIPVPDSGAYYSGRIEGRER